MREHQIVITLKPEQFLQVQRLSRGSGAKSMGIFVRQKLLAALGIEGSVELESQGPGAAQIQPALDELKRLHNELKGYVSESSFMYLPESINALSENALSSFDAGIPVSASSELIPALNPDSDPAQNLIPNPISLADDNLEKLADSTFAISPRLGSVQANPLRMSPSELKSETAMEEIRDPLKDLLTDEEIENPFLKLERNKPVAKDEDDFGVPLAILERRKQLAEALVTEEESAFEESTSMSPEEKVTPAAPPVTPSKNIIDEKKLEKPTEAVRQDEPEPKLSAQDKDEKANKPAPIQYTNVTRPSEDFDKDDPLSGGPPPKRR